MYNAVRTTHCATETIDKSGRKLSAKHKHPDKKTFLNFWQNGNVEDEDKTNPTTINSLCNWQKNIIGTTNVDAVQIKRASQKIKREKMHLANQVWNNMFPEPTYTKKKTQGKTK